MDIKFLGQCGFLLTEDDMSIVIDPVFSDLQENGQSIMNYPPVMKPSDIAPDFCFCTHDHIDHLDIDTVCGLAETNDKTKFVVPAGCKVILTERGIKDERIITFDDGESKILSKGGEVFKVKDASKSGLISSIEVTACSTAHPVHQLDDKGLDRNLLYSILWNGKRYVHLGDTYRTERLMNSLKKLGHIDVLFAPINGRDDEREARGIIGNLSGVETAILSDELKVSLVYPMHFDMVKGNTADPCEFAEQMKSMGTKTKYIIPTRIGASQGVKFTE